MKTHNYIGASLLAAYGLYKAKDLEEQRLEAKKQYEISLGNNPLFYSNPQLLANTQNTWRAAEESAKKARDLNLGLVGIAALIAIMTSTGSLK